MHPRGTRRGYGRPLTDLVDRLTLPARRKRGFAEARILSEWPLIIGPSLAAQCIPQTLKLPANGQSGGTLVLLCNHAWALEIQHQESVIREKIASFFGYQIVNHIIIRQGVVPTNAYPRQRPPSTYIPAPPPDESIDPLALAIERFAAARATKLTVESEGDSGDSSRED